MKVRCIDDGTNRYITTGLIYEVNNEFKDYYILIDNLGNLNMYLKKRFEIVEDNMKEYTIQEILNMENGTIFKANNGVKYKVVRENNYFDSSYIVTLQNKMCGISKAWLNGKYTLVNKDKKVDFMEAIEAFYQGNKIYCTKDNHRHNYYNNNTHSLSDEYGRPPVASEILKWNWYIKAD